MSSLIAFLNARLDEDEALARAATEGPWACEATGEKDSSWAVGHVQDEDGNDLTGVLQHGQGIVIDGVCEGIDGNLSDAAHIARHNPVRVLRGVAAIRKILAWHADSADASETFRRELGTGTHMAVAAESYLNMIGAFVAVYSDHPDYDPMWA